MQLKTNNLNYLTKGKFFLNVLVMFSVSIGFAQEIIEEKEEGKAAEAQEIIDTSKRFKIDGVAAVVGDYVVLESDIQRQFDQLQQAGVSASDMPTKCEMFGKLLEDKLYMHHSVQDSIVVNDAEIRSRIDQQINAFAQQIGSMEALVAYYKKNTEQELRDELYEVNKSGQMIKMMQDKITADIEVTPEEVRQFFKSIPEDERPIFGTELRVAQIVVIPETTETEKQKVIDRLNEFRRDVIDNGASFYFHHNWETWKNHLTRTFPLIKDHVLLPKATKLTEAAEDIKHLIDNNKIAEIIALIPEDWLQDKSDELTPDEMRAAYIEFINAKLSMISLLVKESEDAR